MLELPNFFFHRIGEAISSQNNTVSLEQIKKLFTFLNFNINREKLAPEIEQMCLNASHNEIINPKSIQFGIRDAHS